jgi:hypothetical protein
MNIEYDRQTYVQSFGDLETGVTAPTRTLRLSENSSTIPPNSRIRCALLRRSPRTVSCSSGRGAFRLRAGVDSAFATSGLYSLKYY